MLKPSKRVVLSAFLIFIVLLSAVYVQPATASEFQKQLIEVRRHRLRGKIGIFYDPLDAVISETARDVSTALDMANVSSSLHEVSSVLELEVSLNESGVWIAIYLFNSGLENITLGRDVIGWEDFAQILLRHKDVHHILGIGNTRKLAEHVGENSRNIHLAETDLIDAKLTFLYSLWAVAEVLEGTRGYVYKEAELDIRRVGLKFFADNFNDLFERTLEPKVPLGEEDLVQKQKDFEEMKQRFPRSSQVLAPIPPGGTTPDVKVKTGSSDADFLLADASSVPPPRLYLARMPGTSTAVSEPTYADVVALSATSGSAGGEGGSAVELLFKVLDIPMKSGVDGPIGSVLDFLLEVLIKVGGYTSAALGEDTVKRIVEAVSAIKTIIGLTEDFEGRSALKALFDLIKLEFPALGKYEKYFDLFVDALYAFRGDLQDILNWVKDALVVLIDELNLTGDVKDAIKGALDEILSLGEEFYDIVKSSENVFEALLSWFVERIVPRVVDKFLDVAFAHIPGLSFSDRLIAQSDVAEKIASILNSVVNFVVTSDHTALLNQLVSSVFDVFDLFEDLGWAGVNRIVALIELVSEVLGYSPQPLITAGQLAGFMVAQVGPGPVLPGGWPLWEVKEHIGYIDGREFVWYDKVAEVGTITDVYASGRRAAGSVNDADPIAQFHGGVDICALEGTAIFPVADGTVSQTGGVEPNRYITVETPAWEIHEYGHVKNIAYNVGDGVTVGDKIAEVGHHPVRDHLHFNYRDSQGRYMNPLMPGGPLKPKLTLTSPRPRVHEIYPWVDDFRAPGYVPGNVEPLPTNNRDAPYRFVEGKIDIVARASDPSAPVDAGVMQLMWSVLPKDVNDRYAAWRDKKYFMKDGQWDGPLNNNLVSQTYKDQAPADTNDARHEYFYIITNTRDPVNSGANDVSTQGYWNTRLKVGETNWNGADAASNAEAQYPDGWYLIWVLAGSDSGYEDLGKWTKYPVYINNFDQQARTTDQAGYAKMEFPDTESIYITGEGYEPNKFYTVYIFPAPEQMNDGVDLPDIVPGVEYMSGALSDKNGNIPNKMIWDASKKTLRGGTYHVVVDDGDGFYRMPRFGKSIDANNIFTVTGSAGATSQSSMIPDAQQPMNSEPASEEPTLSRDPRVETWSVPTASTNAENNETLEDTFRNLADQIMSDIREAVDQGQTEVGPFRDKIRDRLEDALEEVGLTVHGSTKNATVDAIVLVAGVMNPNFTKSQLPTLLTVTRNILEGLEVPTDTIDTVDNVVTSIMAIAAIIKDDDDLKQVISGVAGQFDSQYSSIGVLIENTVRLTLRIIGLDPITIQGYIETFTAVGQATFNIVKAWRENTIQGIIQTIIQGVGFALSQYYDVDLEAYAKILEIAFPQAMGVTDPPTPQEAVTIINDLLQDLEVDPDIIEVVKTVVKYIVEIRDVFSDGYRWIFNKIMEWLSGKVEELADYLIGELSDILSQYSFFHVGGEFGLDLGGFTSFGLAYDLALDAGLDFKTDEFLTFISNIIFDGYDLETGTTEDTLRTILSFVEITPLFKASLELRGFGSNEDPLMNTLLENLGVEMQFEGGAHFTLQLLSFKGGAFERSGFMKVIEWGFYFTIEISREFTLFDLITGGAGGGALNTMAEYIGLDTISITIWFSITLEIIKRAASPMGPEQGTFTLIISIGAALAFSLTIPIVFLGGIPVTIDFYGSIQVLFTFAQDIVGDTPLKIVMDIVAYVKVTIECLFWEKALDWGPEKLYSHTFTGEPEDQPEDKRAEPLGPDKDHDGLSDEYEETIPALGPDSEDTDNDGLTDKEELRTTKTDPINWDTDGDGLNDYEEIYEHKTHPKRVDTDYDGLSDYEEVAVYGTKPTVMDTDEDGLDDYYEVNHVWDIPPNVTTSVKEVWIGGVAYNDRTGPLDPDTDDDGLLDGEEGAGGAYYGLSTLYNETNDKANLTKLYDDPEDPNYDPSTPDDKPLIFNYGYTHPLDNDTDDDSYLQLWNGSKALVKGENVFLRSMTDGEEVKGIWVTFITEGEPNRTLVRTNPVNPDTDGDTGATRRTDVRPDRYLNSDGYELSLNPPTDPTNADSDHDGLIDGLEGVLNPYPESYHTNPTNPDTDGDGLGDLQEILLETDPRNADTDFDLVLDGDEYHRFHTDPHLADSDYDGLEDYEELFFWHSNPHLRDSDADGISDGEEVIKHDTDPMDEDTDNDGLTDYDEIFKHGTDPFDLDTDNDRLRDYEEVNSTLTDPLNWDTDDDSIPYLNEYGEMTWSMSDGEEVLIYGTDPARTDTDNDGLSDSIELYLGSDSIPRSVLEPIPLNALNNDTDGDGLLDGEELRIGNTSSIIYPYLALMPYSYYNTSVLIADTDRDGLSDFEEVNGTLPSDRSFEAGVAKFNYTGSLPYLWDTDNDTLSDGDEVFYHGTDPARADTDGDGLADNEEVTLAGVMVGYGTNATNPDTDGDLLPDGYEVDPDIMGNVTQRYGMHLNPLNPDANNNGILDGYEIDLDNDGLSDGEEFFIYETQKTWTKGSFIAGGFLNPDSDGDGLSDGAEVNELGTDPTKYDTDGDGYSDGAEVAVGTDPLSFTSPEEYQEALDMLRAGKVIRIIYPTNTTISDITADVRVVNSTFIETMWFRYNDGTGWSSNYTLQYDAANMQWEYTDIVWSEGSYWIQVFGNKTTGYVVWDQQWFTIRIEEVEILFFRGWSIKILSPAITTIYDKYVDVRVINATEVVNMWFRYDSGSGWLGNYTLQYNPTTQEWENTTIVWPEGLYHLQVFAYTTSGEVIWDEQWFTIAVEKVEVGWIEIMSPANTTILDTTVDVVVVNSTVVDAMWFRYDSGEGWSNNYTLQYNSADQRWENTTVVWPEESYHLQVFATTPVDDGLSDEEWFTIHVEKPLVEPPVQLYLLVLGVVIGGAGTSTGFLLLQRRKRRTEMRKGKGEAKKEGEK